ncbi:MAG: AAA family ATPase [Nanoarchaeota archaeon]
MILKNLKLKNVRSYLEQEIKFDEGSTILSGDVGAGKSTILLAIEFALFGLLRGTTSGEALLRNGKNDGYVELNFDVDGKEITIKRKLRRGKNVAQDSGSIIINGHEKELGATELKQHILDMLNYPKDLITKSKELVYRYTVYTPQEEMKAILLENDDERLGVLRRVFGIDKYKRIKENADVIISRIKEKRSELDAKTEGLERVQEEGRNREKVIEDLKKHLKIIEPKLAEIKSEINLKKKEYENSERELKNINEIKSKIAVLENEAANRLKAGKTNKNEISRLDSEIRNIKSEIKEVAFDKDSLETKEKGLGDLENNLKAVTSMINEDEINIKNSRKLIEEITKFDNCPVCKQKVGKDHVGAVHREEKNKINLCETKLKDNKKLESEINTKINSLRDEIKKLRENESEFKINELRKINLKEREKNFEALNREEESIKKEIGRLNSELLSLRDKIKSAEDASRKHEILKNDIENLLGGEKAIEISKASTETRVNDYLAELKNIERQIDGIMKIRKKEEYLAELEDYLDKKFARVVDIIERKIMLKVHSDFNSLLQKWFSMLMDNDIINVRINEQFSPVIEQAGHDISYEYLSGGEKTACALAYRLAMNQVINNLMSLIKTRDLIILDEPTDGFSEEQLDRLRDVIDELNARQIIIVSHESKIESFVRNVLRVEKSEHVSKVL